MTGQEQGDLLIQVTA